MSRKSPDLALNFSSVNRMVQQYFQGEGWIEELSDWYGERIYQVIHNPTSEILAKLHAKDPSWGWDQEIYQQQPIILYSCHTLEEVMAFIDAEAPILSYEEMTAMFPTPVANLTDPLAVICEQLNYLANLPREQRKQLKYETGTPNYPGSGAAAVIAESIVLRRKLLRDEDP